MQPSLPTQVYNKMMEKDYFSQWLGIEALSNADNYCKLKMTIRPEMLNGFGIVHGGITFSLADSALAFAANANNTLSVTLDGFITYPNLAKEGDTLFAEAKIIADTRKTATFDVVVCNQNQVEIGLYRATVYKTKRSVV